MCSLLICFARAGIKYGHPVPNGNRGDNMRRD